MKRIAIIGTGPAGLMAAWVTAQAGYPTVLFEKKRGAGKKLLIAGSSGLNVTHDAPIEKFHEFYHEKGSFFKNTLQQFPPTQWLEFIKQLGIETFLGTSRRYFVEGLKASPLLRAWIKKLKEAGVVIKYSHEMTEFQSTTDGVHLKFKNGHEETFAAVCLALGGGAYEKTAVGWPQIFKDKSLKVFPLVSSNAGYEVKWTANFLKEAEGQPLKNIIFKTSKGEMHGDLVITKEGLEGTPVYTLGESGSITLDLKPDLSEKQIAKKIAASKENLAPLRRVKKYLNLSPAALALLFHMGSREAIGDVKSLTSLIKNFPLTLGNIRPLKEAISSAGGLSMGELNKFLMLKKYPGVFVAGEMLDWDAPTGGFLIQGCVSQGYVAGMGMVSYLGK